MPPLLWEAAYATAKPGIDGVTDDVWSKAKPLAVVVREALGGTSPRQVIEGKPVGIVYPDQDGMGTLIIPNCAVLIAGGPDPEAGRRFIDYLLEAKTERALAESDAAQMPLRPGIEVPRNVKCIAQLKSMAVDYTALGQLLDGLSKGYLKDWVDRNRR